MMLEQQLQQYQQQHLLRKRAIVTARDNNTLTVSDQKFINFASNDYLALATDKRIKQAYCDGVQQYGAGSGASAMVSGCYEPHATLERLFAEFMHCEQALLFNCGYLANLAVLSTLGQDDTTILLDKYCHASLIDGVRLSSAKHYRFAHQNHEHLAQRLATTNTRNKLVVTEGVFSVDGDIAKFSEITRVTKLHQANLIVDDAHGIGVLGDAGKGVCEFASSNMQDISVLIAPLGKAFASMGAIVAGKASYIQALMQFARSYIYTTALPPAIAYGIITTLKIIAQENWRRQKLHDLSAFFLQQALERQIPLANHDLTAIHSVVIANNEHSLRLHTQLKDAGYYVTLMRAPSVPAGKARLRISLNCNHSNNDITNLLDYLAECYHAL